MTTKTMHIVHLLEFEAGWGSRVDEVLDFDDYDKAEDYIEQFNSKNKELQTPDWYMVAEYVGTKQVEVEGEETPEMNPEEVAEIIKRLAFALECRVPDHPEPPER